MPLVKRAEVQRKAEIQRKRQQMAQLQREIDKLMSGEIAPPYRKLHNVRK